jgi:hypothetical protein
MIMVQIWIQVNIYTKIFKYINVDFKTNYHI